MQIKSIISQNRHDFTAIYYCEHCGNEIEASGYDDSYFHNEVVPDMICDHCGRNAGDNYSARSPKYPDGMTI